MRKVTMSRLFPLAILLMLVLSVFIGCDKRDSAKTVPFTGANGGQAAGQQEKLDEATLRIMIPGSPSPELDEVIAEAERRMKDTINVKLDFEFVPWSDLAQKTQMTLASGENIDIIFDAPWLHINQMIASGYYEQLDGLLPKYGPNIVAKRPQQMWDANKYEGKIMAIPLGVNYMSGHSYIIRKDIREKLGFPPIQTYDELIQFAYEVKAKEPDIAPMTAAGSVAQQHYSLVAFRALDDYRTHISPTHALGSSLMLHYKNNDGKAYNLFEDKDSIWGWLAETRKWYEDGLVYKDILSTKDFQSAVLISGKAAIVPAGAFGLANNANERLQATVPGAELETVTFFDPTPGANITNFKQWNFLAIPKVSKNKERALMFLNWANEKDNYDLLAYGIKGKHWKPVGDDKLKFLDPNTDLGSMSYALIWNPVDERSEVDSNPKIQALEDALRDADNFTKDILTGFEFDGAAVQNEIGQFNTIEAKYYPALFNGVLDPEATMKQFEEEAGPALKKIQVELQKQIDAFLKMNHA